MLEREKSNCQIMCEIFHPAIIKELMDGAFFFLVLDLNVQSQLFCT